MGVFVFSCSLPFSLWVETVPFAAISSWGFERGTRPLHQRHEQREIIVPNDRNNFLVCIFRLGTKIGRFEHRQAYLRPCKRTVQPIAKLAILISLSLSLSLFFVLFIIISLVILS